MLCFITKSRPVTAEEIPFLVTGNDLITWPTHSNSPDYRCLLHFFAVLGGKQLVARPLLAKYGLCRYTAARR